MVTRLTQKYVAGRTTGESFNDFVKRIGKVELKAALEDLAKPPADPSDRSIFSDWGDPREYTLGDMGVGECAGEVVSTIDFDLAGAEREVFEAQVAFESGQFQRAGKSRISSMLHAAKGLVKLEYSDVPDAPEKILAGRARYCDTQKFWDTYAGGKFANYLFDAHQKISIPYTEDSARYLIDGTSFHRCSAQLLSTRRRGSGLTRRRRMNLQHVNVNCPSRSRRKCILIH